MGYLDSGYDESQDEEPTFRWEWDWDADSQTSVRRLVRIKEDGE